jgi:hypothetical protein
VTSPVGRKSRFTFLLPNEDRRSAAVIAGVADALRGLPEDARRTATFGRGTGFAGHATLDRDPAVASYFCDPHGPWQNDRVWRQACFQAVPVRSMALSVTTSSRMQAVSASLEGFPARRSRSWKAAIGGLAPRAAATAAMYRQARKVALPPPTVRLPRILPLPRPNGATPARAAAWRRVREPSKGLLGQQRARAHGADARHRARQLLLGPPRRALPDRRAQVALDRGQRLPEPAQAGVDPLAQGGIGHVAPVALGDQHPEQPAPPRQEGAEVAGGLVRQGPRGRSHRLREAGDRLGVEAVGLRQPPGGAREGAHLAGIDDRDRQAGRGQGRREADLQPAGGLEHDERRSRGGQALGEPRHALVVVVDGEALAGGTRVDVEPVLGDVDADEGGSLVHDPSSLDAGFSALVTVRVARTRPARRHVLPRPRWTCGRAGSRRPARSRHQIGSRQHTKGGVENLNGRARRFLPRRGEPEALTPTPLRRLADRLDDTPRRCLGHRTPGELFREHPAAPTDPP